MIPSRPRRAWLAFAAAVTLLSATGHAQSPLERPTSAEAETSVRAPLAADQAIPPDLLAAFVDGVVRQAAAEHHLAGVAVSVVQNGHVVLKRGYGAASLTPYRPVDPDRTLFRLGSVSETFTWILLLKDIEAGRARLDGPVNLYLPESLRIADDGFATPIRLRDLIDHTAGFEDRALGQAVERDYARVRALNDYLRDERPRRVRAPRIEVSASPYGAALAGAALTEITGRTFEAQVEGEIAGPLGLQRTTFREPHARRAGRPGPLAADLAADIADGYRWSAAGYRLRPFEYLGQRAPSAAGSSTAGDMARFMLLLLGDGVADGARLYGDRVPELFTARLPAPVAEAPGWQGGLQEMPLPGGFTGLGQTGDTLSFHSSMILVPRLGLGVFVTTNTAGGRPLTGALASRLVAAFYAPTPGPPPRGSQRLKDDRALFEGQYRSNRRAYRGLEGFIDRLTNVARVSVGDDGRLGVTEHGAVERFAPDAGPAERVFLAEDGARRMVFQIRSGAQPRYVDPSGMVTYQRIGWLDRNRTLFAASLATALGAIAAVAGVASRRRRDFRQSSNQGRAGILQMIQALLWIAAFILFGLWAWAAGDPAALMYDWPGLTLIVASSCALVASVMALPSLALLPFVWRGGRRVDSWSGARKMRYTLTTLIFLAYGFLLALWGALEPWRA